MALLFRYQPHQPFEQERIPLTGERAPLTRLGQDFASSRREPLYRSRLSHSFASTNSCSRRPTLMISTCAPLPATSLNAARLDLTAHIPTPAGQAPLAVSFSSSLRSDARPSSCMARPFLFRYTAFDSAFPRTCDRLPGTTSRRRLSSFSPCRPLASSRHSSASAGAGSISSFSITQPSITRHPCPSSSAKRSPQSCGRRAAPAAAGHDAQGRTSGNKGRSKAASPRTRQRAARSTLAYASQHPFTA